jgi:hypothetical protein
VNESFSAEKGSQSLKTMDFFLGIIFSSFRGIYHPLRAVATRDPAIPKMAPFKAWSDELVRVLQHQTGHDFVEVPAKSLKRNKKKMQTSQSSFSWTIICSNAGCHPCLYQEMITECAPVGCPPELWPPPWHAAC